MAKNKDNMYKKNLNDLKRDKKDLQKRPARESGFSKMPFKGVNYLIFLAAVVDIVIGFFLLEYEHLTLAPVVLVLGFCVLLPLAPLWGIWNDGKLE